MYKFDSNDVLLIVAPHPDDEVIGSAGLIQKIKNSGGKVYIIFLTNGDTNDFTSKGISSETERIKEINKVRKYLSYDGFHVAFRGNDFHLKLDLLGQKKIMDMIERDSKYSIEKVKPTIIVFPSKNSYNQDHRIAAEAVHACLRVSSKVKHFIKTVLSYEFPADFWSLENEPHRNFFVTLSRNEWSRKLDALKIYKSQCREFPSSRSEKSLSALATLRGGDSVSDYAEAYYMFRGIAQ